MRPKKEPRMVQRLPLTEARNTLGAVVKRIHLNKEYVILEKDGIPLAGVMDIDEFEDYLELRDPKVRAAIAKSRQEHRAGKSRPARSFLVQLLGTGKRGKVARRQSA